MFGTDLWYNPCQQVHPLSVDQTTNHHYSNCKQYTRFTLNIWTVKFWPKIKLILMETFWEEVNSSKIVLPPFWEGVYSKRKEFAPCGVQ